MRPIFGNRLGAVAMALLGSGCFAVVDVDRFHTTQKTAADSSTPTVAATGAFQDLKLSLVGMSPHVTQLFEFRIVDSSNYIQSRGIVNPLGAPDVVINMPNAVPTAGAFHLDFYADVDGSGAYNHPATNWSTISNDHSWRIEPIADYPMNSVTPVAGLVQMTFTHSTLFTDIDTYPSGTPNVSHDAGLGAVIRVTNADALRGDLIQARVADTASGRTLGLFRLPAITSPAFNLTIPGIPVEVNGMYTIYVYVDANANSVYENPANPMGDLGWSFTGTASATGLDVPLDASNTQAAKNDVGAP